MGTYILLVNSTDQGAKGVREIPNRQQSSRDTAAKLGKHPAAFPHVIVTSAEKGLGVEELRATIAGIVAERA